MYRSRANQLLKIEKENENKGIKTNVKSSQSKCSSGAAANITEKICQFSAKNSAKYVSGKLKNLSNNDSLASNQRQEIKSTTGAALTTRQNDNTANLKMLYMPPTSGPKPHLGQKQIKRLKDPPLDVKKPAAKEEGELSLKPCVKKGMSMMSSYSTCVDKSFGDNLNENNENNGKKMVSAKILLTASTSNSNPELLESARANDISSKSEPEKLPKRSSSTGIVNLDLDLKSLDSPSCKSGIYYSASLFQEADLMTSSSESGASVERQFRSELNAAQSSMKDDDIKVVKKVLKADERYSLLGSKCTDPKILKDVLKTQLDDIVRNEQVVKSALVKLGVLHEDQQQCKSHDISEIAELFSQGKENLISEKEMIESNQHTPLTLESSSGNNSPEREQRSAFEVREIINYSDDDPQLVMPSYEKHYVYTKNRDVSLKYQRSLQNKHSSRGHDEFSKGTLPIKLRNYPEKEKALVKAKKLPSKIEVRLDRIGLSEDDESNAHGSPQVTVMFKNVISLKNEIRILRQLGDRLDATLHCKVSDCSLSEVDRNEDSHSNSISSMASLTTELRKIDSSIRVYPGRRSVERHFEFVTKIEPLFSTEHQVQYIINSTGLRHDIGIVNEFMIVSMTIGELRCNADTPFYIPRGGQFLRMSFERLRIEPDLFLEIIKPKKSDQYFNILDHDPVFFNSFFKSAINTEAISDNGKWKIPSIGKASMENMKICERGDSLVAAAEGLKKSEKMLEIEEVLKKSSNLPFIAENKEKDTDSSDKTVFVEAETGSDQSSEYLKPDSFEISKESMPSLLKRAPTAGPILPARRRRIRRNIPPTPLGAFDEPKNKLIQRFLIGIIQLSIFMGLVVALSLPDIKC